MNKKLILCSAILIILLLIPLTGGCKQQVEPAHTPIAPPPVPEELPSKPAEFHIDSLTTNPSIIMVGDSVTVTACIKNVGELTGTFPANLIIDGEAIESKDVSIEPGESKETKFQTVMAKVGSCEMTIGEMSNIVTVHEWVPYEIRYDSGKMHSDVGDVPMCVYTTGDVGQIVHFTPQTTPFKVTKILISGEANMWDLQQLDTRHFTVRIWNKDKNEQLWSQDLPWRLFNGPATFRTIEVSDIRVTDDFHVEFISHSEQTVRDDSYGLKYKPVNICLVFDKPKSHLDDPLYIAETRSGISQMGEKLEGVRTSFRGINWFIRVEGEGRPLETVNK